MDGQTNAIRKHLEKFGKITTFEAFEMYGVTRLSARIYDLRSEGMNITTKRVTVKNRFGNPSTFVEYILL